MNHDLTGFVFVVPPTDAFYSGGNLYNAALLDALVDEGHPSVVYQPKELSGQKFEGNTFLFWDTLFLDQLEYLHPENNNWLIVHHLESLYPPKGYTAEAIYKEHESPLLSKFDGFIVSSVFTAQYLQQRGLDNKKIVVVEPALDNKPPVFERSFDNLNALIVANLQERKGIEPFLQALKERKIPEGLTIKIVGGDQFETEYAQRCKNLIEGSPRLNKCVHYIGTVAPQKVWEFYALANLFISTAYMETYGMAIQEAAASGLPLLVMNGGNAANHVKGDANGRVCNSMGELADQLCLIAGNPGLHKKMALKAERLASRNEYSWSVAARLLVKELVEMI